MFYLLVFGSAYVVCAIFIATAVRTYPIGKRPRYQCVLLGAFWPLFIPTLFIVLIVQGLYLAWRD